jgi:hypothetical protein
MTSKKMKIEDDIKKNKKIDPTKKTTSKKKGRQPQKNEKWKTTSNKKMEYDLKKN